MTNLAKKVYIRERLPLVIMTVDGPKEGSSDVALFSIHSETCTTRRIKFVFTKTYGEKQYDTCINKVFRVLVDHHTSGDGSDSLSQQIAQLPENRQGQIFLVYDEESNAWHVSDPIQNALDQKRADNLAR